jgi:hypothetical protein
MIQHDAHLMIDGLNVNHLKMALNLVGPPLYIARVPLICLVNTHTHIHHGGIAESSKSSICWLPVTYCYSSGGSVCAYGITVFVPTSIHHIIARYAQNDFIPVWLIYVAYHWWAYFRTGFHRTDPSQQVWAFFVLKCFMVYSQTAQRKMALNGWCWHLSNIFAR